MWRIKHDGLTLHEVLIMAYMNILEAQRHQAPQEVVLSSLPPQGQRSFSFKAAQSRAV